MSGCGSARPGATHVLVMAKSPLPGRVKTRLCPPLSAAQAAEVAAAALADTLDAVAACSADRRVLALDGPPGDWIPPGFELVTQRGDGFAERLAAAWRDAGGPGVQIGMDTPQVSPDVLDRCLEQLLTGPHSAVLGPTPDGGWWALGRRSHLDRDVFAGVPMSTPATYRHQVRRLEECGHEVGRLPDLTDVDDATTAELVAGGWPHLRFSATWKEIRDEVTVPRVTVPRVTVPRVTVAGATVAGATVAEVAVMGVVPREVAVTMTHSEVVGCR